MSQYKTGTVSVTNGSATVTGSGTLWIANLASGNLFTKEGDNVAYTIASVDSDTVIQLTAPYAGSTSSGSNYGVTIDFTSNGLPLLSPQDLNTAAINSEQMKNIDNDLSSIDGVLSGLGTAAQANLTSPSATIFDDGNLNTDLFGGSIDSDVVMTGVMGTNTTGIFYANTMLMSDASNITYSGLFKIKNVTTDSIENDSISSLILTSYITPKLTRFSFQGVTNSTIGDILELRCDGGPASILIEE